DALETVVALDYPELIGWCLVATSGIAAPVESREALLLLGSGEAAVRSAGAELGPAEQRLREWILAPLRERLGRDEVEKGLEAGHGRQVLVSASTHALLDPRNNLLLDLGEHRLKDLSAPERIYQAGEAQFPRLKTLYQTNLPVQATPLVGRERELAEVIDLVRSHRLVTLVGAG